jgi:phosphoadenosine phosphosulfate reductase
MTANDAVARASELSVLYEGLEGADLLRPMIESEFRGRIALSSSFGAEAAVLLHMVAEIDPATPVLFLDTGKLFGETKRYRRVLSERLGFTDVRDLRPDPSDLEARDRDGVLWQSAPDSCCYVRKVLPLRRALQDFDAWINGRKRFQGGLRHDLPPIEEFEGRIKLNPLANWTRAMLDDYIDAHDLPRHPLIADGFASIGCMPCTAPAESRDGRWAGREKTECGIHLRAS